MRKREEGSKSEVLYTMLDARFGERIEVRSCAGAVPCHVPVHTRVFFELLMYLVLEAWFNKRREGRERDEHISLVAGTFRTAEDSVHMGARAELLY
jgi:hypothetical protein